jgi:hypothetical protein
LGWIPLFRPKHISLVGARFRIRYNGRSRRRYLVIHGNEEDGRKVLTDHIRSHEGVAFIVEGHDRNVPIEGGQIDPNRMFSRVGAERNLKTLNTNWPPDKVQAALHELDEHRGHLVRALMPPDNGLLIALHNNVDYSVNDELAQSDAKSIRQPDNPHAFFLCTNPADFKALAESAYNVVLQQKPATQDDGSLSRLCAARGVRYVNLETHMGEAERQMEMLQYMDWVLGDRERALT